MFKIQTYEQTTVLSSKELKVIAPSTGREKCPNMGYFLPFGIKI